MKHLLLYLIGQQFEKKLRMTDLSNELILSLTKYKEIMLRRWSVTDVLQLQLFHFPHLMDEKLTIRDKLIEIDVPIGVAFGDRDYLCSRGTDEIVRRSKHFSTGHSQIFKVADSSHFMQ